MELDRELLKRQWGRESTSFSGNGEGNIKRKENEMIPVSEQRSGCCETRLNKACQEEQETRVHRPCIEFHVEPIVWYKAVVNEVTG